MMFSCCFVNTLVNDPCELTFSQKQTLFERRPASEAILSLGGDLGSFAEEEREDSVDTEVVHDALPLTIQEVMDYTINAYESHMLAGASSISSMVAVFDANTCGLVPRRPLWADEVDTDSEELSSNNSGSNNDDSNGRCNNNNSNNNDDDNSNNND